LFRVVYRGLEAVVGTEVATVVGTEVAMEVAILVTVDTEGAEAEAEASGIPGPPIHFTSPVQMILNAQHIAQI